MPPGAALLKDSSPKNNSSRTVVMRQAVRAPDAVSQRIDLTAFDQLWCYRPIPMRYPLSTVQVAKLLGMKQPGLQRLIRQKRVPCPPVTLVGGMRIRLWSREDVKAARAAIGK
jgi:hypothetical protein